jgi:hypothetical protein
MHSHKPHSGISRRKAIETIGLGAATTIFTACALNGKQATSQTEQPNANQSSEIITKDIPRTKERVPAIGLGTFLTFDVLSQQPRDNIRQVMQRFWNAGGCIATLWNVRN